ncbi:sigma-54 interaction domain-containing protein [Clostridium sp. Cult2]|uniref:sigma-54 interaction domain-containing protein n=1 Tax=Clostridium sp. Cult2 TaxID=2079003 RepID=UPI001F0133F8|nr:sigma 54-interacting transcriptional regulator [Clostridium sp. Cult2]MCF6465420.1 hypothetical protein [Clostridium sp. Cult2]
MIVSEGRNTGLKITNQLNDLFGNHLIIKSMLISEIRSNPVDVDLILFTSAYLQRRAIKYIDANIPNMIAKRLIDHKNIAELISIEEGKDVLFINDSYESTQEAIEQLIELGLDHIRYHQYYPGCNSYPKLEIAITPGESQLLPYKPNKLIDIGTRILDIQSIHDLASNLGLDKYLKNSLVTDYIRDIIEISKSIEESRRASYESQKILQTIVNNLEYGVAFVNLEGKIMNINSKFEYILGLKKKDLLGKKLNDLIFDNTIELKDNNVITIQIENKELLVQVRQVNFSRKIGYIILVTYNNYSSKTDLKSDKAPARYNKKKLLNFDDYLTINKNVVKMLKRAKKFAKSDGAIIISGESGTGKEILAQAIHMNSFRNKNAFVPINIATLPKNLVESELFGYEEGTFTGAIKGGKLGIFEIANGGTIFIDEIGDVPLNVQAKLLRVLEEKKIRKVGSADEFPIDVRIIAATNKNLLNLIEENRFRLDLFFRLNILPLETIPLRERIEDIVYMLKHFINVNLSDLSNEPIKSLDEFFEEETIAFLKNYKWPGNVRELINLTEYLSLIYEGKKIAIWSLHSYMYDRMKYNEVILDANELWVLSQFEKYKNIPLGRTKLTDFAKIEGKEIGEGKIRRIISNLINMELIESYGNLGSSITDLGIKTLRKYN